MAYVVKLSVLILTYNRLAVTSSCVPLILDSLKGIESEVLVWDNCSVDGTFDWLLEYQKINPLISSVHSADQNFGVEATNFLANSARGEFILKIDDDIIPPPLFAKRMVDAFERVGDPKLAYLGFDIRWGKSTFATRSGMWLYGKNCGKTAVMKNGDKVLIHYHPSKWMINGACRLSKKETFLALGGHPTGVLYGVDLAVSRAAEAHGYYIGYLTASKVADHVSSGDSPAYRQFKNRELKKAVKGNVQGRIQTQTKRNITHPKPGRPHR